RTKNTNPGLVSLTIRHQVVRRAVSAGTARATTPSQAAHAGGTSIADVTTKPAIVPARIIRGYRGAAGTCPPSPPAESPAARFRAGPGSLRDFADPPAAPPGIRP